MDSASPEPALELSADLSGFFRGALTLALQERGVEATESTEHYLVALLTDFARPAGLAHETLERPLTFLLDEALSAAGSERFERLRVLGDAVLYTRGFFSDHLETRGVELNYVSAVGARAYDGAASMLRQPGWGTPPSVATAPQLFEELAGKFTRFADVLTTLADGLLANAAQTSARSVLRLYERWLRTGSKPLAEALVERGLLPTRGTGVVH